MSRDMVTFLDGNDSLTVVESRHSICVGSHGGGRVNVSIEYSRREAEALCRDLAARLGLFVASERPAECPVAPDMTP